MRTVYKYTLPPPGQPGPVEMPRGSRIVAAGFQGGAPVFWAEVDTDAEITPVRVCTTGTGHPVPDDVHPAYVHRVTFSDGPFVWHVWQTPCD